MIRGRFLALLVFISPVLHAQEYCLALRGNGELMSAHWGAMANLTEKLGMPVAQAGGSSASITMMMNEAVASNKFIIQASNEQRKRRASLLYKSMEGFAEYLTTTPEWRDFLALYQGASSATSTDWLQQLQKVLEQAAKMEREQLNAFLGQNLELVKRNYNVGTRLGLISETNYAPLMNALKRISAGDLSSAAEDVARAKFYAAELKETIRVFGSFNAKTDANLFFRPGLVDFTRFGEQVGRMAQFYSALSSGSAEDLQWEEFFKNCAETTGGMLWSEIAASKPECPARLNGMIKNFLGPGAKPNFSDRFAGLQLKSYPTTSVIVGEGIEEVLRGMKNYATERSSDFGFRFYLSNPENIKFGYWGDDETLARINLALPKDTDEKSRRFMALGQASWKTILGLSPAEPGLASMQAFLHNGKTLISAGGWSDLHPVMILRAAGCKNVIYVTRRGGESPFAQGVARRLFSTKENDPAAEEILNKLYSMDNPRSSMRQSLDQADAVLCTDWNRFLIKDGIKEMIRDSYRASPYFVRNASAFAGAPLIPQLNPRDTTPTDGKLTYEGCF